MKDLRYLFIINPAAGQGRTAEFFHSIKRLIDRHNVPYEHKFTTAPGEATALARAAQSKGYTHVVSVGGDGTSHEIVNGIIGSSLVFGALPSGSGNDFPKSAGIPLDAERAAETIFSGFERRVDIGMLGEEYFINGLGIGLDGSVSHRFKSLKRMRGQFGYLIGAVQEALSFKGFGVDLKIDGWSYSGVLLLTGASNGVYQGGKFKLAPDASIDDGFLDFHIIKDMPSLERLLKIPKVLQGTHSGLAEVELRRGSMMEISLACEVPAHMDGEPFYLKPGKHKVEVVPGALRIMSSVNYHRGGS